MSVVINVICYVSFGCVFGIKYFCLLFYIILIMFKILDNTSYAEIMKMRPFGWEYDDPQTFESFEFERIEPFFWHDFITSYWKISYYASAIYVAVIFGLQRFMRDRPALKLKWPLFIWNTVLGIFSIVG